ncbi:flavin reductase family protein [Methylophilus sp. 3sh_L]|uniref:flavin reductase family protein n=1 Tax=Methylophilus sp. 3sh_L TaxID=3377114 RepID=UPI00398EADE5
MREKTDFPVSNTRQLLEPGPIVLISSAHNREQNIMTMGWHMMMEYTLIGCYIWDQNYSRHLIEKSGECVINIPTVELIEKVIDIGNMHHVPKEKDKFELFGLTPRPAKKVNVPLIDECYANIECSLIDKSLIKKYSLFIFEVLHVHIDEQESLPETFHYLGDGQFRIMGDALKSYKDRFQPDRLQ